MSNDSAKIVIEAEDKASAQIRKLSEEAEKQFNRWDKIKTEQLQQLEIEKTLLREGAEAAEALKLQQQGLDAETAKFIARERALIQEQKKLNEELDKTGVKLPAAFKETKSAGAFLNQLSSFAGGGVLSSLTNDVASLTNRLSQFKKSAESGEAATLGMKAGLIAASVAIGYQVGSALHDLIFNVDATINAMQRAEKEADRMHQRTQSRLRTELRDRQAMIELSGDPTAVERARVEEMQRLNREIENSSQAMRQLEEERKAAEEQSRTVSERLAQFLPGGDADSVARQRQAENAIEQERQRQDILVEQRNELQRQLGIEQEIAQRRREAAETQQSQSFLESLQNQLVAVQHELEGTIDLTQVMQNTIAADREAAVALLQEIEATKQAIEEKKRLEREKEQAARNEEQRLKRLQDLQQNEIDRLTEQRILLEQGAEAAQRWRLEKQGLSAEAAAQIAAEQARLDKMKKDMQGATGKQGSEAGSLQATESRLLTRGPADDPQKQIIKLNERMVKLQEQNNRYAERQARRAEQREQRLNVRLVQ